MESPSMLAPTVNVVRRRSSLPFVHHFYILLKAHYFLYFSAFGILYPVMNITLRGRGLSTTELSYINIIIPFLVFFTNPLLGFIADHSRRYLSTFNIILVIITITFAVQFGLPSVKSRNIEAELVDMHYTDKSPYELNFCASQEVATKCASRSQCGCSYQANCTFHDSINAEDFNQTQKFSLNFTMNANDFTIKKNDVTDLSELQACGINYQVSVDPPLKKRTLGQSLGQSTPAFGSTKLAVCEVTCSIAHFCHGSRYPNQMGYILVYSLLFVLGANLLQNAIALGASIGFATIDRPEIFGQQRIYGTIGFGAAAFGASRVYEWLQTEYVYIIMFCIANVLCIFVTSFIRIEPEKLNDGTAVGENIVDDDDDDEINDPSTMKDEKPKKKSSLFALSKLVVLLKRVDVIIFLILSFTWGMSYAALDPYLYLYIDEIEPCKSRSIVGLMSLVSSIAEVSALYVAGRVLKFLGTNVASIIIFLAFAVRFSGYYFITAPYYFICMESMHFFNFGILYVLMTEKADSIAPDGLSGTLQGVALGVSFGLGRGAGLLAASFIYALTQQPTLFLVFALFNLIAAIIYILGYFIGWQSSKKNENDKNANKGKIMIQSGGCPGSGKTTVSRLIQHTKHETWPMIDFGCLRVFHLNHEWTNQNDDEEQMSFENLIFILKNYHRYSYQNILINDLTDKCLGDLSTYLSHDEYNYYVSC
ncbi:unnamed protein product [Rotaria magnacalcarata]